MPKNCMQHLERRIWEVNDEVRDRKTANLPNVETAEAALNNLILAKRACKKADCDDPVYNACRGYHKAMMDSYGVVPTDKPIANPWPAVFLLVSILVPILLILSGFIFFALWMR